MTARIDNSKSFEDLRREIDGIDQNIHALLMRRADVVGALGEVKKASGGSAAPLALRPGREAEILRRLSSSHDGLLPLTSLLGVWRSIMAAFLHMQTPFSVLVPQQDRDVSFDDGLLDLARSHFGAAIPIKSAPDSRTIIARVAADPTVMGVMPGLANGWWNDLPVIGDDRPRIVASLPFWEAEPRGYLVSRAEPETTGSDIALVVTRGTETDRAAILAAGRAAGLDDLDVSAYITGTDGRACHLLQTGTPSQAVTGALTALANAAGGDAGLVGLYARPLSLKSNGL